MGYGGGYFGGGYSGGGYGAGSYGVGGTYNAGVTNNLDPDFNVIGATGDQPNVDNSVISPEGFPSLFNTSLDADKVGTSNFGAFANPNDNVTISGNTITSSGTIQAFDGTQVISVSPQNANSLASVTINPNGTISLAQTSRI